MSEIQRFLRYLETEKRSSEHTIKSYALDLEQFSTFMHAEYGESDVSQSATMHVRSWLASLREKGMSAKSIHRKRSALSTFFKYLRRSGVVSSDPVAKTRSPKMEKRLPVFVEEKGMSRLLEKAQFPDDLSGFRDQVILILLYETGMRLSELIGLTDGDLEFIKNHIRVLGKRNKERLIPLREETINLLNDYQEKRRAEWGSGTDALLVTDSGLKLYPRFVYRKVNYYLGKVTTLEKRSPHVLRHTFATHMLNNGAQLNSVKELLGHASLAATQVYTHNTIEKLKRVHELNHPKG